MITRLEVDGFKSLRDFAIDLEPLTVLIGPNSAGKSNVLDALALLSRLASQPIAEAFKGGRGKIIDQFSRHRGQSAERIRFAVELLEYGEYPASQGPNGKDALQSRFRYELTIERKSTRSGAERLVARDERLRAMRREDDAWIAGHPEFATFAGYRKAGEDTFITIKDAQAIEQRVVGLPSHWPEERHIPQTHTALAKLTYTDAQVVGQDFDHCRVLHLGAEHLGQASERIDSGELLPDASNLPTVLADLPPVLLGEIRADMAALVPGIASLDISQEGDDIRLDFELSGGESIPGRLVSAGTLRILALLTALRVEPRSYMLCIEEPENGIYPGRLRALLELLRKETVRSQEEEVRKKFEEAQRTLGAASLFANQLPTQILLTTHSPVVLAALRAHPRHLRFIDMIRRNGERITRARTVGKPPAGDYGRTTVSPREIDTLLQATQSEDPA